MALAALITAASSTAFAAGTLIFEVDSSNVATYSAAINATTVQKVGAGEAVFQGAFGAALELQNGQVEINGASSMPTAVEFNTNAGNILEVNQASLSVPALTMTEAGQLLCTLDTTLAGALSGPGALTVDAAANQSLTIGVDTSASINQMIVNAAANVKIGGAGFKMPAGNTPAHDIAGSLQITAPVAGSCAGLTDISGTMRVDTGTIPAVGDTNDVFASSKLKFADGATLVLGDGVVWDRAITVGSYN